MIVSSMVRKSKIGRSTVGMPMVGESKVEREGGPEGSDVNR